MVLNLFKYIKSLIYPFYDTYVQENVPKSNVSFLQTYHKRWLIEYVYFYFYKGLFCKHHGKNTMVWCLLNSTSFTFLYYSCYSLYVHNTILSWYKDILEYLNKLCWLSSLPIWGRIILTKAINTNLVHAAWDRWSLHSPNKTKTNDAPFSH